MQTQKNILLILAVLGMMPNIVLAEKPQEIRIEATEYKFTVSQDFLKVSQLATLTLANRGKFTHQFESELFQDGEARIEFDGATTVGDGIQEIILAPGKTAVIHFVPRKKGTVEFQCRATDPEDHFKHGMKGAIKIQ